MLSLGSAQSGLLRLCVFAYREVSRIFSTSGRLGWAIFVSLWLLYAAFPTRNHYWDGIGFALNIEGTAQSDAGLVLGHDRPDGSHIYFNPNHLLHNLLGFLIYRPIHLAFPAARALDVLVAVNSLLSAVAAALLFRILYRWCRDLRLSLLLTLLLALSGTWWKFSTDANAYVPSVFFLVACTSLLTNPLRRPPLLAVGVLHAAAILIHQIAVLFYPAVLVALWIHPLRRRRKSALVFYTVASALPVLAAYLTVWFGVHGWDWSLRAFVNWITYNGTDVYTHRSLLASLGTSVASLVRVFFGGRISLAWQVVPAPMLFALVSVMVIALVRLFRRQPTPSPTPIEPWPAAPFFAAWAAVFQLFLFFWLTEYPYYRLFCLPSIILCLAVVLKNRPHWQQRLPAFVLFLGTFNFAFMIYPYSLPESTPPVQIASEARSVWRRPALVLYREATCDNWFMRYFNPHTAWAPVDPVNREHLAKRIEDSRRAGHEVWIDTTLLSHLRENGELREWVAEHGVLSAAWGVSNGRYHIQFAQLLPHQ